MKTKIISLYGGPSSGKSTSAAYLFYLLKNKGINSELVREYIKSWAWDQRKINTYDQIYFLGKQTRQESMLYGKVDVIVTDCPVMMGAFYGEKYCPPLLSEGIRAATLAYYNQAEKDGHQHHHVFLKRTKPYNPAGRYQTEVEARNMDTEMRYYLRSLKIQFEECGTTEDELSKLLDRITAPSVLTEEELRERCVNCLAMDCPGSQKFKGICPLSK